MPELPPARIPGRYAVAFVCLGNICRSPMADVVLTQRVDEAGLAGRVTVSSCGTGDWHVGDPMDRRAAATLLAGGYDPSAHRARQFDRGWAGVNDLVLAMDRDNLATVRRVVPEADPARVRLFGEFDPVAATTGAAVEVPDPYYGGEQGFEEVLAMVERTCASLVAALQVLPTLRQHPVDDPR